MICIPPITTSPFAALCDTLCGRSRRGCGVNGCTAAGCDGSCHGGGGYQGRRPRTGGWLAKLTNHGRGCGGAIRCVKSLGSRDDECGTRCTYEWSAVPVDACGRRLIARGTARADADEKAADGPRQQTPPPAPAPEMAPEPPTLRFDDPETAPADAVPAPPALNEQGVAEQALDA